MTKKRNNTVELNLKESFNSCSAFKKLPPQQKAAAYTLFLKQLSLKLHAYYQGKITTAVKVPLPSYDAFNLWYTPGVSAVSLAIKDKQDNSFTYTNRAQKVAVISDSTRVLGDGNCGPSGGLGVMEGKALLMNLLGGMDAVPLCIDSRDENGRHSAKKIIDFVNVVSPSFGVVNLEDISQPNCYIVLDSLRKSCPIPVWHDDAQGTSCIITAALLNALKLVHKKLTQVKIVLYGAGSANTSVAKFLLLQGVKSDNLILFDSKGPLSKHRTDLKANPSYFRQWELCKRTNALCLKNTAQAFKNADVLIALSKSGPNTIAPELIKIMAPKPITFLCANPVPEIYPEVAKQNGAYIIATGRGDYPNQVNNSLCFPGILKGALMCRAKTISDGMAFAAANAIAKRAQTLGLKVDRILPSMADKEVYALTAAAVAQAAKEEGLAQIKISKEEVYKRTKKDILKAQKSLDILVKEGQIEQFPQKLLKETLKEVGALCGE